MRKKPRSGGKPHEPRRRSRPSRRWLLTALAPTVLALAAVVWPGGARLSAAAFSFETPECPDAETLCVEAEEVGGIDMASGTAFLQGGVVGVLKPHDMAFRSRELRAFRNEAGQWTRLELDREVELEQPGRRATADHAVVENDTGVAVLTGRVRLSEPPATVTGDRVRLERQPRRSIVDGSGSVPMEMRYEGRQPPQAEEAAPATTGAAGDGEARTARSEATGEGREAAPEPPSAEDGDDGFFSPWWRFYRRNLPGGEPAPEPSPPVPGPSPEPRAPGRPGAGGGSPEGPPGRPDTVVVTAQHAVLERGLRQAHYEGEVYMRRMERHWQVWAETVDLTFGEDRRLQAFRAEGDVRVEQPGRTLTGEQVVSRDAMETLVVTGDAHATQAGEFDLASERIEVYTDVNRGLVRSGDRDRPVRLTLEVGQVVYRLDAERMDRLRASGVARVTLRKLDPMLERTFDTRTAFEQAVRQRLALPEANRHLDTIVEAARRRKEP